MKSYNLIRMKKYLFVFAFLWAMPFLHGQAFDGKGDVNMMLFHSFHPNGALGIELGSEIGVSHYFSVGFLVGGTYVNGPVIPDAEGHTEMDEDTKSFEAFYLDFNFNFHYSELLGMNDDWDLYSGFNIMKNFGFQTAVRYKFARLWSAQIQVNVPIKPNMFGLNPGFGMRHSYLQGYEKPFLQIGIIFG